LPSSSQSGYSTGLETSQPVSAPQNNNNARIPAVDCFLFTPFAELFPSMANNSRATATRLILSAVIGLLITLSATAHAWDATGHRLGAYVAWASLSFERRAELLTLLESHPRYQEDFVDEMPLTVMVGSEEEKQRWLLGQAAVWPDLARNFDEEDRIRYNRPTWHYIDGAWVRGEGQQGNVYVGVDPQPTISGAAAGSITDERDVDNVVLALDYNTALLDDASQPQAARAIALCWVLHLTGDIHQPLHSGALVSTTLFPKGDRGGNGIPTRGGNLHSDWDGALRNQPFEDTLRRMVVTAQQAELRSLNLNFATWLQESRRLLLDFVYPDEVKATVLRSERLQTRMEGIVIDSDYLSRMQAISEDRVTLAAMRLIMLLGGLAQEPLGPLTEVPEREADPLPNLPLPVN